MQITRGHREVPDPKAVVRRLEDGGGRGAAVLALGVQLEGLNLRVVERTHESRAMSPASASSVWGFEAKPVPASCMQVSILLTMAYQLMHIHKGASNLCVQLQSRSLLVG